MSCVQSVRKYHGQKKEIRDEVRKGHETTTKTLMGNIGEFGKLLTTQAGRNENHDGQEVSRLTARY